MPSSSKSKSKMEKSTSSSSIPKKYQGMTLDELSKMAVGDDDDDDEEINEDEAFNSEDEKNYGQYFQSSTKKTYGQRHRRRVVDEVGPRRNIALSIPMKALTSTKKDPTQQHQSRSVAIANGSTLTISSVCLDVMEWKSFERARLMYRCQMHTKNDDDDNDDDGIDHQKEAPFLTLCNFLVKSKGGIGLMPLTPMNLKVIGPCTVDFRADALPRVNVDDTINVFGVVEPSKHFYDDDDDDEEDDDDEYFPYYADAFMSGTSEDEDDDDDDKEDDADDDDDDEERIEVSGKKNKEMEKKTPINYDKNLSDNSSKEPSSSRKRKQDENVKDNASGLTVANATISHGGTSDEHSKLTKAQRKKLAQEKAKQLEDTLAAARINNDGDDDNEDGNEPQTKKSKKQMKKEKAAAESANTQTRERRLAGGLIVSNIVLGVGAPVKPGKRISLHYTGRLRSTGKVFDKNHSKQHPLVFRQGTGEVIRGLERGLEGMRAGGERVITIPSALGYGSKGAGADIPPDSDLVFEVKVLKVG